MKRKLVSLMLMAAMLLALLPQISLPAQAQETVDPLSAFTDLPSQLNWAYDGIVFCLENGYMYGMTETRFESGGSLTRGQMVTLLYRISGSPAASYTGRFVDVGAKRYYTQAVEWAAANGIVMGVDETHFAPEASITRQQIAAVLYRFCGSPETGGSIASFPDAGKAQKYAVKPLCWAVEVGLISGVSAGGTVYLQPLSTSTRGQIATILMRLMNIVLYTPSLEAYEGLDDYMLAKRIDTDMEALVRPYENKDGVLPHDSGTLEKAGQAVYGWARQLKEAGIIQGATYNAQGHSVAFFLKDGTTSLYLPSIENSYSGAASEEFGVMSVTALGFVSSTVISGLSGGGAETAAETIYDKAPEYTELFKLKNSDTKIDNLKRTLGSLGENSVRALFWRGHGDVYTELDGSTRVAFVINEKKTRSSQEKYYDDLHEGGDTPKTLASCGNYYAVNSLFFDTYLSQVDGGLFYCGCCQSANDGGDMARILFGKGFDAYCGSSGDIFTIYSDDMSTSVARHLTELNSDGDYYNIASAMAYAQADHGPTDIYGVRVVLSENPNTDSFRLADPIGYKTAYAKVLQDVVKEEQTAHFQLGYIDEDEIPELIISEEIFHMATVQVYTFYDGAAVNLGRFGSFGTIDFAPRENILYSGNLSQGMLWEALYRIEDGKAELISSFFNNEASMMDEIVYEVNGKSVSKSEYEAARAAARAGHNFIRADHYNSFAITTENIEKMLKSIHSFVNDPDT